MEKDELMPVEEFCAHYQVEYSFLTALEESGLIVLTNYEEKGYLPQSEIPELEKLSRLHYELDINLEGIEAIAHLLKKHKALQEQIHTLEERVRLYESLYGS